MCYDAEAKLTRQIKDAKHQGAPADEIMEMVKELWLIIIDREHETDPQRLKPKLDADSPNSDRFDLDKIIAGLPDFHHVNGRTHPSFVMMTDSERPRFAIAEWRFVHRSCKTRQASYNSIDKPWINSLNAQSETMFDKPTFAEAALRRRCVVSLDSYYEHHHQKGTTFPFRISHAKQKPLYVASIFNKNELLDEDTGELVQKNTVAFLTCKANRMMSKIHNNPKVLARTGPRMPVILNYEQLPSYLKTYPKAPADQEAFKSHILTLCQPYSDEMLTYHTVRNLIDRKNKPTLGNTPEITAAY